MFYKVQLKKLKGDQLMKTEKSYECLYKYMEDLKSKDLKVILNPKMTGVIIVDLNQKKIEGNYCFTNKETKYTYISQKQSSINFLIQKIILQNGNREKIKLRNFFFKSYQNLWKHRLIL